MNYVKFISHIFGPCKRVSGDSLTLLRLISWMRVSTLALPLSLPISHSHSRVRERVLSLAFVYLVSNSSSGKSEKFLQCTQLSFLFSLCAFCQCVRTQSQLFTFCCCCCNLLFCLCCLRVCVCVFVCRKVVKTKDKSTAPEGCESAYKCCCEAATELK